MLSRQLKQKYWYMLHTILEARMKSLLKEQGREDFSGVQTEDLLAELRSVTRNTLHPKSMLDGTAEAMADLVFDLGQQFVHRYAYHFGEFTNRYICHAYTPVKLLMP